MKPQLFVKRTCIDAPADAVFAWHESPGALDRLQPPWQRVQILEHSGGVRDGAEVTLRTWLGPLYRTWVVHHHHYQPGRQFCDRQVQGPFAMWDHTHRVEPRDGDSCFLEDRIEYALPLSVISDALAGRYVRHELQRVFDYRHDLTAHDIAAHHALGRKRSMNILISGSRGLIGTALVPFLTTGGHNVLRLVRSADTGEGTDISWSPEDNELRIPREANIDAVVHLAGESIADQRWSEAQKRRIRDSRVNGTRLLCESLAGLPNPPEVLVSASAVGYYGDRGEEVLTESSPAGSGFLAETCEQWEQATQPARDRGIRVVHLRLGVVLSPQGGALAKMLRPFKLGLAGRIGSGRQYMSWIALEDAVGAIYHSLGSAQLSGAVNAVAPNAVTNKQFTKTLGRVLRRLAIVPMPAPAARLAFGELADELLLASARAEPQRLLDSGFNFRHPELEGALRHMLGKSQ